MRKLLLATTAAALALTLSGGAFAELDHVTPAATTPADATDGLVFSKDADQAKPIEAKPVEQMTPPVQAQPAEQAQPKPMDPKPAAQAAPAVVEDPALTAQLKDLVETKLQQYVPKEQDRAGVLAFYKARDFAPIWIAGGKAAPRAEQAKAFLKGVGADGLDPADYPTPAFADPGKFAADELALTQSVITFARHASIGRVAFSRVSGAVYFDQKAPGAADVLGKVADSTDVRATLDQFNPQAPGYKALKAELAAARSGSSAASKDAPPEPNATAKESKAKSKKSHRPHEA